MMRHDLATSATGAAAVTSAAVEAATAVEHSAAGERRFDRARGCFETAGRAKFDLLRKRVLLAI